MNTPAAPTDEQRARWEEELRALDASITPAERALSDALHERADNYAARAHEEMGHLVTLTKDATVAAAIRAIMDLIAYERLRCQVLKVDPPSLEEIFEKHGVFNNEQITRALNLILTGDRKSYDS